MRDALLVIDMQMGNFDQSAPVFGVSEPLAKISALIASAHTAGALDMTADSAVQLRKQQLLSEAEETLAAICAAATAGEPDPLTDPATPTRTVTTTGILGAPGLRDNPCAKGQMGTLVDRRAACIAADEPSGKPLSAEERIARRCAIRRQKEAL